MGCFSFLCKKCGEAILSDSSSGQPVVLCLLENGKVSESMEGQYDSYGRVFDEQMESINWNMEWDKVCDLMSHDDKGNGIAAIHTACWTGEKPTERSEDDPNQGWGQPTQ